ncbi:MAG: ABC transporter permease [Chloroherpetonaceae bacterium]|nr:ABC transporter permease [Chloroherpetonaceae bacterium]MDW8437982.1 ABC transporter permease [Chloroherpetonaceae bacterium]
MRELARKYATSVEEWLKGVAFAMQEFLFFSLRAFGKLGAARRYWRDVLDQAYICGVESLPILIVSALSIGSLIVIEVGHQLAEFGAKTMTGRSVALSVVREISPLVAGLMLAARVGARNSSELGAMQISEQIDALRAFGTDPIAKLVVPRLVAAALMFAPLIALCDVLGLVSGAYLAEWDLHLDPGIYWNSVIDILRPMDWVVGFSKPPVFAIGISLISCYNGFATTGGTAGVGRSTIKGIVYSSAFVLITNFYLSKVILDLMRG